MGTLALDHSAQFQRLNKHLRNRVEYGRNKAENRRRNRWGKGEWSGSTAFSALEGSSTSSRRALFPLFTLPSNSACDTRTTCTFHTRNKVQWSKSTSDNYAKETRSLWSPRFGDNASSGLTSEPQVPTSQTKHADCQPKQTSLLTTRFCLDDFPLKQKTTKRALSSTECAPLFVRSRESHGT